MTAAIVFGGTSGIGLATARELVAAGMQVTVVGRDVARGERAAHALGTAAAFVAADVARAAEVEAAVAACVARWGRLDAAVNAAALADVRPAPTADITEAEWDATMAVDLKGVWLCMRSEIPVLLAGGGGAIVNVSSVNGLSGTRGAAAYCAAKHALHGLSKTAAIEYAPRGIRINVVCPGAHRTPMLEGVFAAVNPADPAQVEARYLTQIPAGRLGDPAECGRLIAWLVSPAASYVTGAVMTVDGGMSAG